MAGFIRLASRSELPPPGEAREFQCGEKMICVANVGGTISAMDNVCPHRGGPVGQGVVEGNKVICPWHGWQFDASTGEAGHNPSAKLRMYPLKVEGEEVMVEVGE